MIITDIDDTVLEHMSSTPIQKTIDYINSLNTKVIVISGRSRSMRAETEKALQDAGLKYSSLLLNPYNYRFTNKWKAECAEKLSDATLAIDDNTGARNAYEKAGIKTIHPNDVPDVEKFWTVFETNSGY
jgi:hydroxymethylpyrimidine pyrophosphatase-like HAD family hydrolase